MKTVYFGSGWFTEKQVRAYNQAMSAVSNNPTVDLKNSYVPKDHQYHGLEVEDHPELLQDLEWSTGTYRGDLSGLKGSDVTLAVYIPSEEDSGLAFEIGYAAAIQKPVIMVIPDEEFGNPINLMPWGGADNVIKMSGLKDYDFNMPQFDFYRGGVY